MQFPGQAVKIRLTDFKSIPMRTFHITWFSFFTCFFSWFAIAPLMPVLRDEFQLTQSQIGNTIIASVAATIFVRLLLGRLCDRFGPRRMYTGLMILGSLAVMGIGLSTSYEHVLIFRLVIGGIGASFVLTQYHTSIMFAPNVVGTANATTAGWGNLGGGVTQMVMPLIFAGFLALGWSQAISWRLAMIIPGILLLGCAYAYWNWTSDYPSGEAPEPDPAAEESESGFGQAAKDWRVWLLFLFYGACFGIELTVNNVAALYYTDRFGLSLTSAGLIAGLFGATNIFARSLGGWLADKSAVRAGLRGRVWFLAATLALEGIALFVFSKMSILPLAIASMIVFSIFVQMAEGATYAIVPFVNRKGLGSVAGIVGAGGNVGAVLAGFLFREAGISMANAFALLACGVTVCAFLAPLIRFSDAQSQSEDEAIRRALMAREAGKLAV
ncbi:MFS transporter [Sulfidibacter corallicola]|uniref:MFS transporter n=1 Tax=Sulfidibacter corallicola TaxID=2818388 RepID=A0A8A4TMM9_SULCO|nr:MFS transporter [Sulfidibacter corallicola]QTD51226.1 MFS transporter [Sulfidibacter corallicola]